MNTLKRSLFSTFLILHIIAGCSIIPDQDKGFRPITDQSNSRACKVYDFVPAPGQFINDGYAAASKEEAINYAENQITNGYLVSLGSFGGYIILGFDHSIVNIENAYDFGISGNSFESSSEPGIIYVMKDENKNGMPDDTWFELKGSEYGKSTETRHYEVTYYKPQKAGDIKWKDNAGNEGEIPYLPEFHKQNYYPEWISDSCYTLSGTRLAENIEEKNGIYESLPYEWGYADNNSQVDKKGTVNYFKLENAVDNSGKSIVLDYIDFIKIQSSVLAYRNSIGEISTEISSAVDCNMLP